jgi:ribonuclease P protein component
MASDTPRVLAVHDSATFHALRSPDRRSRRGAVRVAYLRGHDDSVRAAYAISRRCGGAVVRNRIRRRLRAAMGEVVGGLPRGTYLLSADRTVADLPFSQLKDHVEAAATAAGAPGRG